MKRIGKFQRRGARPNSNWWRERMLLRASIGSTSGQNNNIESKQLDALSMAVDTFATVEIVPTTDGLKAQYLPFEHFLLIQDDGRSNTDVSDHLDQFMTEMNPLVDRQLQVRLLNMRAQMPESGDHGKTIVYFGAGLFVPESSHEIPRGRAYLNVSFLVGGEPKEYDLLLGGKDGAQKAGWFLWQDRLSFAGWSNAPAMPPKKANLRQQLGEDSIYFVNCSPEETTPVLLRQPCTQDEFDETDHGGLRRKSKSKHHNSGAHSMISQTSVLPPSQELEEYSDPNGPNDLIYQASIGADGFAAEDKSVSLRIEPNSSISRLRRKASFAEPVYLEILGVLIPRALKTNGLLSVSVHCDANNQLLAHALRRHVLSLVLRRKTGWLNDVLAWLRLQDSDEVLRCTERPTELLHASSHWNVYRDGLDVRISLTNDWPLDEQICNVLPEGLGLPANPGLPLHGCHVVRSMANTPLGYMMLPVHPSPPLGFETWAEPLHLRYKRRETVDDLPARDCLIDWLDEAIHVEAELEEFASERRGYADWLSTGQSDAIYEFLKPEAHFECRETDVTPQQELVLSERIGGEVIETVIKPNKSFRLGPLLCRLRSV